MEQKYISFKQAFKKDSSERRKVNNNDFVEAERARLDLESLFTLNTSQSIHPSIHCIQLLMRVI